FQTRKSRWRSSRSESHRPATLRSTRRTRCSLRSTGRGRTPNSWLLAVLVVDGEWTGETLRVMANVFDYVVPISRVPELVETIKAYLAGDKTKLKWLIQFKITAASSKA